MNKCALFTIYLIILSNLNGCHPFSKNLANPYPLSATNLSKLNGQFEITAKDFDSLSTTYNKQIWMYNNFFTEVSRSVLKNTIKLDSLKTYYFELKVDNPKELILNYKIQDSIYATQKLHVKLKSDGYLYLKNKNLKLMFLPYIAGGIDIKKTRFTLASDGNLLFDVMQHRSGAFLIIVADGRTWRYRNEYPRVRKVPN